MNRAWLLSLILHLVILFGLFRLHSEVEIRSVQFLRIYLAQPQHQKPVALEKSLSKKVAKSQQNQSQRPTLRSPKATQEIANANAPVLLGKFSPQYPKISRIRKEQGRVLLKVDVSLAGEVIGVNLESSSGYPELDKAALEGAKKLKFEVPAGYQLQTKEPVLLAVNFKLH